MTNSGAIAKCNARAELCADPYRRRKARKFRTWTFSAGARFTREMRQSRRRMCYVEVAKHANCARGLFLRGAFSPD